MKVILRKNDSATSALLFVYNMVHTKAAKDYLYLSSLLEIMSTFGKTESAIRMSLSRACKAGILENVKEDIAVEYAMTNAPKETVRMWNEGGSGFWRVKSRTPREMVDVWNDGPTAFLKANDGKTTGKDVVYTMTAIAKGAIKAWNEDAAGFWKRFAMRQVDWDGKWYTVSLVLADGSRKAEVTERMQELGFAPLDGRTWLSPYDHSGDVSLMLLSMGIADRIISVSGALAASQGTDALIEETYGLAKLRPRYLEFIGKYQDIARQVADALRQESFIKEGMALPLLHQLGWDFFGIASEDAMLPKTLCPEWEGDKAAVLMRDLRSVLDDAAWRYLAQFV